MTHSEALTPHRKAFLRELASANTAIQVAGALVIEDDGFQWVNPEKMPPEFMEYYSGLVSAGYAIGAI